MRLRREEQLQIWKKMDAISIRPHMRSDLTKDCEQMNDLTDVVVTYDFSDRKETVDRSVIKGMAWQR